jgi:hypothetical protein
VVRRDNGERVDAIKSTMDIMETEQWLQDTQYSVLPTSPEMLLDQILRAHLTYFTHRAPISDCVPFNEKGQMTEHMTLIHRNTHGRY